MKIPNIKALGPVVSDKKFFHIFYVKIIPLGRDYFWPKGYYLNKLGRGLLGEAKYQISIV